MNLHAPSNGLPNRINRLLAKAGFPLRKEAIIRALQTGKLSPFFSPRTYGKYTHRDVCRWAGVNPDTLPLPSCNRAPTIYRDIGLSYRAWNCLREAGIALRKPSVLRALKTGDLSPGKRPVGYGPITHAEVCLWAGFVRAPRPRIKASKSR